jgi:membrane protease YdiL (CAAX protease family)
VPLDFNNRLNRLFEQCPRISSVGILLLAKFAPAVLIPAFGLVLTIVTSLALGAMKGRGSTIVGQAALILVAGAYLLTVWKLLARRGWSSRVGLNGVSQWREVWLLWLPAIYALLNLVNLLGKKLQAPPDWTPWLQVAASTVSVPLIEESVFRCLILAILLNRFHRTHAEVIGAVLFSSMLFGLWHITTLWVGVPWQHVLANIVYATLAGVGFCAVVLRTRCVWLIMVAHAGMVSTNLLPAVLTRGDVAPAAALISTAEAAWRSAIVSTLVMIPLFSYGLWLLRDIGKLNLRFPESKGSEQSESPLSSSII